MIDAGFVFKILNFLAVMGLFIYLIRRYGILQIVTMMREEKQEQQELRQQLKSLQVDCNQIEQDSNAQEQSYRLIKDKFQVWQKEVATQDEQIEKTFQDRQKIIRETRLKRIQALQQRMLIKKELPKVLHEVSGDLKDSFAQEVQQKKYTDQLLSLLEKSNQ